ncbi:MAG: methionine synthase [Bacteroidaceae bacterium]|nr:methionine synthase [Bacteroidaceae bacterium]
MRLKEALKNRILLLDGAMGTMLPRGKGLGDLLCLSEPDVIRDIHEQYLQAGADLITTCTFNAQRISLADYQAQSLVRDINIAAARLARELADKYTTREKPRFVLGSVGPTSKSLSLSPDVENPALRVLTFDELSEAYEEQMEALVEGGVDALLIETIFDTLNAKAAIYAAQQAMARVGRRVPLMLSVTVSDRSGRMLTGQTLEAFLISVSHADLLSVGLNCSFGAHDMLPNLRTLSAIAPCYVSAYPNAGMPNTFGEYDQTPDMMCEEMRPFVEEGLVNIIGGCCGTTPAHIRALAGLIGGKGQEVRGKRNVSDSQNGGSQGAEVSSYLLPPTSYLQLSGLEPLILTPEVGFINVGERCNVAGSRKFLRLIKEGNYDEALSIARQQVEAGAMVIDITMDDGLLDARREMTHFLNLLTSDPDISRVPVMIDSSDWQVIVSALKCLQGKSIVNSISLKEGEAVFLDHARQLRRLGAAVVVMLFDEEGQATTYERRIDICERAYRLLTEEAHFPASDIIFDPNVLAICTGMPEHDGYASDFLHTVEWIRHRMPLTHISGGVSNLSFAFRGNNYLREAMHAVFLYHARRRGMDMAIMNPASKVMYSDIPADLLQMLEDVILRPSAEARERLIGFASDEASSQLTENREAQSQDSAFCTLHCKQAPSVEERLVEALRRGNGDNLETDLAEALQQYPRAVDIIEGPLMKGMNLVGELFGQGKMFLPQVVKTARTMKQAVEYLKPHLHETTSQSKVQELPAPSAQPKVLLATVKGDVHDIGKNIVGVVMACNGYEVIDMGVMVPAEDIVRKAKEVRPDVIGLSGLITPSLDEMVHVVRLLHEAGISVPVMIGGATTSRLHTALKIAPVYGGPVIWVRDASQNAPQAARFLNADTREAAFADLRQKQTQLREGVGQRSEPLLSLEEARRRKPNFFEGARGKEQGARSKEQGARGKGKA